MAQDRVEAVERALTILEVFDAPQERFTLAELAAATGFYKSTLLRLLGSLERFDYVQRDRDGRFRLGRSPVRLARRHLPNRRLETWIQPVLEGLAEASGETAALLEADDDHVECRLVALPACGLRHDLRPGTRWRATADAPALDFAGGCMVCRPIADDADQRALWLALSGPAGRLDPSRAARQLDAALAELARRPGDAPRAERAEAAP
ncbi:helix-turn-helix domain-containing protein [Modicisalibacter coralii]|uniref:helix-turn-helix domain-containing protein n=1 Tax=Modicisalibacter coralii TaxID=2304602 RepID=UPI00100BC400|nr:helix-turn-helix domain-containing protein [Halomonas coralii]